MSAPVTYSLDELAEFTGKSAKYWEREAAARSIPQRRFGKTPRFTAEDLQAIYDLHFLPAEREAPAPAGPGSDPLASRITRGGGRR